MNTAPLICAAAAFMTAAAAAAPPAPVCRFASGEQTAALVELYTSEGCSSCPPADRQLSALATALEPGARAVPIALHVNYWDKLGWADPFAQAAFSLRQDERVRENHHTVVYTPHFFVNGEELRAGATGLRAAVHHANAQRPRASIAAQLLPADKGEISVDVTARADAGTGPAALYVAIAQNGIVSDVRAGENSGERLQHEHVVRLLDGPLALADGAARLQRRFALPAGSDAGHLELVAFVEDAQSGAVLQSLRAGPCDAGTLETR
jgi:hypothetical protein